MADNQQYLTLGLDGALFAAPVESVQEILEMRPIARLPKAPSNLLGMIDVRGQGIPVIDLRETLGMPAMADNDATRIVVLRIPSGGRELTVGLKADRVFEVTVLDDPALDPPPDFGVPWSTQVIAGIGRRRGAFVTVFDLDHLLSGTPISVLAASPDGAELAA